MRAHPSVPHTGIRVDKTTEVSHLVLAQQLAFRDPTLVLTHQTAAQAWGNWLPRRMRQPRIHVSRIHGSGNTPRFQGAEGHPVSAGPDDLRSEEGVRLTSPEWTWTDLASQGLSLNELVAAGDALLQREDGPPRPSGTLGHNPLRIVFDDGWETTADLVYKAWRTVLQYEGKHHFSEESQYRRDMRRDRVSSLSRL